jgi:hypothetical protein
MQLLLHLWTDFDTSWLKMKIMVCRCARSRDFTVQRFLQELWPLTHSANYTFLGKPCRRNSSYIYEPISMQVDSKWRSWCVVMHEVAILWFNDFCESYDPWVCDKLYIARVNRVNLNSYGRILPRLRALVILLVYIKGNIVTWPRVKVHQNG